MSNGIKWEDARFPRLLGGRPGDDRRHCRRRHSLKCRHLRLKGTVLELHRPNALLGVGRVRLALVRERLRAPLRRAGGVAGVRSRETGASSVPLHRRRVLKSKLVRFATIRGFTAEFGQSGSEWTRASSMNAEKQTHRSVDSMSDLKRPNLAWSRLLCCSIPLVPPVAAPRRWCAGSVETCRLRQPVIHGRPLCLMTQSGKRTQLVKFGG